eukprot:15399541-Alexandrium_andersonii.AAC.1
MGLCMKHSVEVAGCWLLAPLCSRKAHVRPVHERLELGNVMRTEEKAACACNAHAWECEAKQQ